MGAAQVVVNNNPAPPVPMQEASLNWMRSNRAGSSRRLYPGKHAAERQ